MAPAHSLGRLRRILEEESDLTEQSIIMRSVYNFVSFVRCPFNAFEAMETLQELRPESQQAKWHNRAKHYIWQKLHHGSYRVSCISCAFTLTSALSLHSVCGVAVRYDPGYSNKLPSWALKGSYYQIFSVLLSYISASETNEILYRRLNIKFVLFLFLISADCGIYWWMKTVKRAPTFRVRIKSRLENI